MLGGGSLDVYCSYSSLGVCLPMCVCVGMCMLCSCMLCAVLCLPHKGTTVPSGTTRSRSAYILYIKAFMQLNQLVKRKLQ